MRLRLVLLAISLCTAPKAALAQDHPWSFEAAAASEYTSKGAGRSDGEPHLALQVQRRLPGDTFAGVWSGSLKSPLGAEGETQLYLGWRPKAGDWSFDVRPMAKLLVGATDGEQDAQFEFRIDAARPIGRSRVRLRLEFAPNGFGSSKASTALTVDA